MRWYYKALLIILLLIIIASAAGTIYFYNRINSVYEDELMPKFDQAEYHFSLILKSDEDVYWQDFKEGVYEAARDYSCAIEYNPIKAIDGNDKMVEYINIAEKSRVDGIIVNGDGTLEYESAVNHAADSGMPIVLGGVESINSTKFSYVGTNFYEYGMAAARVMSQIPNDDIIEVAVILSSQVEERVVKTVVPQNDMMLSGLISVIEVSNDDMHLISTQYRESDLLGAEDLMRKTLTENPEVDVIFCVNARDTMAASRVIVERNLVGKVFVVGTDITESIKNYIDKGIIYGTLERNGYEAGYKSVETLMKSMDESFRPSYEDIDIDIFTKTNIASYHRR